MSPFQRKRPPRRARNPEGSTQGCPKAARAGRSGPPKHELIALNVQGITGKKRDYTSLPYSKIQSFSVETAGTFDLDAELELWFSGLGKVKLEFKGGVDIRSIGRLIADHVL
jgi:Bacterial PH domain